MISVTPKDDDWKSHVEDYYENTSSYTYDFEDETERRYWQEVEEDEAWEEHIENSYD